MTGSIEKAGAYNYEFNRETDSVETLPVFEGAVEGYVANFLKRNFWKVRAGMTYDDALQEAKLVFWECVRYYEHNDRVTSMGHFMSLFKTALARKWVDLAAVDSKQKQTVSQVSVSVDDEETIDILDTLADGEGNLGELFTMVRQAPDEVKAVLGLVLNAPAEVLQQAAVAWKGRGRTQELGNAWLCCMLGKDANSEDLVESVRRYFAT